MIAVGLLAALAAAPIAPDRLDPLVEKDASGITACGLVAAFKVDDVEIVLRFANQRGADGPVAVISASGASPAGPLRISALDLSVAGKPAPALTADPAAAPAYVARGRLDPDEGALFFRSLFVGGFKGSVQTSDAPIDVAVQGPLPNGIRATFLNCSGDLYRQDQ